MGLGLLAHTGLFSSMAFAKEVKPPYQNTRLVHGVAYYPELWPIDDVPGDIAEMKKLGINSVRMAEFAWSIMEPERGDFRFDLFKGIMDKMHDAGIGVVLCTPTATPPVWLTHGHPERCHKNEDGVVMSHGARQHASYEHPEVRKACFSIIQQMAQQFGDHPALIGWQLDNEMKAHVAEDFSDAAIANWRIWLKRRFGNIDALNEAWGTHTWSEYYQRFDQVPAPFKTPFMHNASLSTAYKMFCRESIAEFMLAQRKLLKAYSEAPVTHNDNPAFNIHHEASMAAQDFASFDAYPSSEQWLTLAFRSDMYRAAIPGRPFWLMETSVSHNGWLGNHQPPHPRGFLAAEAALVYALGGEGFCYWLWRQQRTGAELPHSAVMSAWNEPGIGYPEVEKVNRVRTALESLLVNSQISPAEVAVTYSDHARAMIETEALDKREGFPNRYRGVIEMWHSNLMNLGYHRDVRFENAGLEGLKLLLTPAMPYVSEAFLARVMNFVKGGGIWIAGPVTGTRGKEHTVPVDGGLGLLDKFAGIDTRYVVPLTGTDSTGSALGVEAELSGWCAAMKPAPGTRVIGNIISGVASGHAFICERSMGKGKVVVLGAHPGGDNGQTMIDRLILHYASEAGVQQQFNADSGVVVAPHIDRSGDKFWLVVNMKGQASKVELPSGAIDGLTNKSFNASYLTIPAYEWRVIYPKA